MSNTLRITEIFHSLQGESSLSGLPTVFVRLTGCPLRCQYCDTAYAFSGGVIYSQDQVLQEVASHEADFVTVTGGEPLAQPECLSLLGALCDAGYKVSLETGGAMDISAVDERVSIVMDLKTPASGEQDKNLYSNIDKLGKKDQLKFVICNREDYLWAKKQLNEHMLDAKVADVLFSPSNEELSATELAEWILADKLKVRFQIQLHKYLWGNKPGH
ncbi:MAG: 7-carboxy-7-deazaguanine synthase QueE [Gammaproteobacteria bacterium]|nr:7-carboxy-7-deazaguanine synthase QueE [Gammaproteobacteria bacterium]